jgi:lysine 2,3-aminomutase
VVREAGELSQPGRSTGWRTELAGRVIRPRDLPRGLELSPEERAFFSSRNGCRREAPPFAVTRHLLGLMDPADPGDPIRRQFLPTAAELSRGAGELDDPLGEDRVQPVPGLLHRYPDRALLLATDRCAAYCRHCFRRRASPGRRRSFLSPAGLERAAAYLGGHPEIRELILSGGDPLLLSDARLRGLFARFRRERPELALRVHTRLPVVLPRRVTPALARLLAGFRPLRLVVQVNHARELDPACRRALGLLAAAGLPLLAQSVLLAGVNDRAQTLAELFAALRAAGVRPYYLFQPDLARGTAHFRPDPARGLRLYREAAALSPGAPRYMLDLPGGGGKVPVEADLLGEREEGYYLLRRDGVVAARYPCYAGPMSTTRKQSKDFASVVRKTGKKLGKTLRGAAKATAKVAGKTAEVVAARAQISTKQVRQKAEFLKMGESFYRARKSGMSAEQIVAAMQPQVGKLDNLQQEIATLQLREKSLRNSR